MKGYGSNGFVHKCGPVIVVHNRLVPGRSSMILRLCLLIALIADERDALFIELSRNMLY